MVQPIVFASLAAAAVFSFWSSLVEATYLTLRPFSLSSSIQGGSSNALKALEILNEKTKLVSVTTLIDTICNVVLASAIGLILAEYFGPIGWLYSAVVGSFVIMTLLYLLPKAIGIENSLRAALYIAPASKLMLDGLSPMAVPLTSFARALSARIVGKPGYREADLVDEFEDVVTMLEKAGHIEPDAGRLLRTALTSSRNTAGDVVTDIAEIVHITSDDTVYDALKAMGRTNHPRLPVFDIRRNLYIGAVTFRTITRAIDREHLNESVLEYMTQPAKVNKDDGLASVMEKMQDAGTTIAFVYEGDSMVGMITLSDIIEQIMGVRV
ncbi:MAG: CNNM domain-containing protein [Nitrososphaerales archaeon]|nr:CNNM domain-containing protein [Nitrososphaerales archaeon]